MWQTTVLLTETTTGVVRKVQKVGHFTPSTGVLPKGVIIYALMWSVRQYRALFIQLQTHT